MNGLRDHVALEAVDSQNGESMNDAIIVNEHWCYIGKYVNYFEKAYLRHCFCVHLAIWWSICQLMLLVIILFAIGDIYRFIIDSISYQLSSIFWCI